MALLARFNRSKRMKLLLPLVMMEDCYTLCLLLFTRMLLELLFYLGSQTERGRIAISRKRGTTTIVMAHDLLAILTPIGVVAGLIDNAEHANSEGWEDGLADRVEYDSHGHIKTQIVRPSFIQILLGVIKDKLIGSVLSGTMVFQPDFRVEAHRGLLYVDKIYLDENIGILLLNVLTEGVNIVEREAWEGIRFLHLRKRTSYCNLLS